MTLQICCCGWYGWRECYEPLSKLSNVYIVAHKPIETWGIPMIVLPNIGLSFHCYDYYIKHIWDKKSKIVLQQDDITIKDISIYKDLERLEVDKITMVWSKLGEERNQFHTRFFVCSPKWLNEQGGFKYDPENKGDTRADGKGNTMDKYYWQMTKSYLGNYWTDKIINHRRGVK